MGGPGNVYQWEKDRNVVATDDVLTLMDIDASSGGIYSCTVGNLAGNDSATTTLYVAPYFIIHPENVETSNSSKVNISCLAESFPEPEYMWMKDGDSSLVREGVITVDMPNSLGFRPVLFGDEGVYVCVAFITIDMVVYNESSDTTVLAVSPEGSIQVNPIAINGNDSGIATFTCMALGGPENIFSWTKVRDNRNNIITNDSELILVDIMASDGGVYQCTVKNLAGSENDTVTLNVSPVVIEHPQDQNVMSFEGIIILSCIATGFPAPTITWFHNNSMEDNASSQRINDYTTRSIFIMSMPATNDSGVYFCRAAVDGYDDVDSNTVTVLVQDIPEQPENVTAVETQSRYLVLMWVEPHDNNAAILGYFVSYNQPVFAGGERITLNVSEEMVNLTNLFPGVVYNFTVIAYNDIGNSTASKTTPLSTLEEVPANSPQNVTAVSLSSTAIMVTWEEVPPIDGNGMITIYEIRYGPLEIFGQLSSTDIINATDLSVILEGLHPFVGYNISVRAYTSGGSGPYSDVVIEITLEDSPGMPQNVSAVVNSSTEIIVFWEEIPAFNRNGTILLYEVLYRSTLDQTQTLNTTDNSTFSLSLQVEEFSTYSITVGAYTVAGAGEESMPIVVVMTPPVPPGTPAPPMVPTMDEITSFSAVVRWNPIPERFANGDITNYVINYRISESGNGMKRQTVNGMVVPECVIGGIENVDRNLTVGGDQTNATLQNLTPNVDYEVKILAVNREGFGEFSNSIVFITNEDVPSAPRNLTVVASSSTSLLVTWEHPLCEYGVLVNYTVTYSPIEDDGTTMGTPSSGENIPPDQSSIQVTNLSINTGYRVSVVAATSAGTGTPAIQTGMTNEDDALIGLNQESYTVNEFDGSIMICVVFLMNSGIQDFLSVNATLSTEDGTAIADEDYGQPLPSSITLTSTTPTSGACSTINIPQDAIEEGKETFNVTITAGGRAQVVDGHGTAQVLIVDNCGPLSPPKNGDVDASITTIGSVATYSCNNGLFISGVSQRICQTDGFWSGSAPTCLGSACPTFEQRYLAQQVVTAISDDFSVIAVNTKPRVPTGLTDHVCGPGNWTQIVLLNLSNPSHRCPSALTEVSTPAGRGCTRPEANSGGFSSTVYSTLGIHYNRVCGRSIGYQNGTTEAFLINSPIPQAIDTFYVDGLSVTHGSPRQHIWSFASGLTESPKSGINGCFCGDPSITPGAPPPPFVGNNYFCESGNSGPPASGLFAEDPLWDGMDCPTNNCCEFNSPPWFNIELPAPTTDDIEVRLCCSQNTADENIVLQLLELYISNQEVP